MTGNGGWLTGRYRHKRQAMAGRVQLLPVYACAPLGGAEQANIAVQVF